MACDTKSQQTADAAAATRARAMQADANYYIELPATKEKLQIRLGNLLTLKHAWLMQQQTQQSLQQEVPARNAKLNC